MWLHVFDGKDGWNCRLAHAGDFGKVVFDNFEFVIKSGVLIVQKALNR